MTALFWSVLCNLSIIIIIAALLKGKEGMNDLM